MAGQIFHSFGFFRRILILPPVTDASSVPTLHTVHQGSISVASGANASFVSKQEYDPWGKRRGTSTIGQTARNYTGQYLDDTGLLYYHARYYDPVLARFVSADSVVPGSASGSMDGMQLRPLTVDFHEPGFAAQIGDENNQPFWFQMSDEQRQQAGDPWGPQNPQALNRYSYVQNAPVRYVDPTGHINTCVLQYGVIGCLQRVWQSVQRTFDAAAIFVIKLMGGDVAWWGDKIAKQMPRRGWMEDDIKDVLEKPADTAKAIDKSTGDPATKYYRSDGHYVIRNDTTGEVIQVSDRTDPNWIDDLTNQPIEPKP